MNELQFVRLKLAVRCCDCPFRLCDLFELTQKLNLKEDSFEH